MNIVQINESQLQEVKDVLHETWLDTYSHIYPREAVDIITSTWHSLQNLSQQAKDPRFYFAAAMRDGKITGVVTARLDDDQSTVLIHRLYVLPKFQGQGTGAAMLNAAVAHFPNVKRLTLEVESANEKARAFYVLGGFRVIGQSEEKVAGIKTTIIQMQKDL